MLRIDYNCKVFFFFNDTATTEIYTLSLHDALPICVTQLTRKGGQAMNWNPWKVAAIAMALVMRSEEHTSELQSQSNLVCRLLLEKKKCTHRTSFVMSTQILPVGSSAVTYFPASTYV